MSGIFKYPADASNCSNLERVGLRDATSQLVSISHTPQQASKQASGGSSGNVYPALAQQVARILGFYSQGVIHTELAHRCVTGRQQQQKFPPAPESLRECVRANASVLCAGLCVSQQATQPELCRAAVDAHDSGTPSLCYSSSVEPVQALDEGCQCVTIQQTSMFNVQSCSMRLVSCSILHTFGETLANRDARKVPARLDLLNN
eukprot:6457122-Amphidinium_carterae.1